MKKALWLGMALLTSACSNSSGSSLPNATAIFTPEARILRSDGAHVILYNESGYLKPAAAQAAAEKYCRGQGKTAQFESQGGYPLDCVSNQLNYCATYICQ